MKKIYVDYQPNSDENLVGDGSALAKTDELISENINNECIIISQEILLASFMLRMLEKKIELILTYNGEFLSYDDLGFFVNDEELTFHKRLIVEQINQVRIGKMNGN